MISATDFDRIVTLSGTKGPCFVLKRFFGLRPQ
jgi:hypothetical protein